MERAAPGGYVGRMRTGIVCAAALAAALAAAGCGRGDGEAEGGGSAASPAPRPEYVREYVFLGAREGEPLVVPFAFRATDSAAGIRRATRAWLAHGATWEGFVEERWTTPATSGVWRVLPHGDLRLAAGGPSEVEALWYRRGPRSLRVQVGAPVSGWVQGEDARFRVLGGRLTLGEESVSGTVLQLLEVDRPPRGGRGGEPADWLFLAGGDSLRMVLVRVAGAGNRFGSSLGWMGRPEGERSWEAVEVDWTELRPLEEARRDIPLSWRFRIPGAGVSGEVRALGFETVVGEESGGRREVEVRYTVEGWVEIDGARSPVQGTVRHSQG